MTPEKNDPLAFYLSLSSAEAEIVLNWWRFCQDTGGEAEPEEETLAARLEKFVERETEKFAR